MFASFIAGRERSRLRIREVTQDLDEVESDLKTVKDSVVALNVQLARVETISNDMRD